MFGIWYLVFLALSRPRTRRRGPPRPPPRASQTSTPTVARPRTPLPHRIRIKRTRRAYGNAHRHARIRECISPRAHTHIPHTRCASPRSPLPRSPEIQINTNTNTKPEPPAWTRRRRRFDRLRDRKRTGNAFRNTQITWRAMSAAAAAGAGALPSETPKNAVGATPAAPPPAGAVREPGPSKGGGAGAGAAAGAAAGGPSDVAAAAAGSSERVLTAKVRLGRRHRLRRGACVGVCKSGGDALHWRCARCGRCCAGIAAVSVWATGGVERCGRVAICCRLPCSLGC